ncbi:MAG: BrnA antitoxin family protein [Thiocapsa sp.]|uniref:BrnA antitoxin family protein n=1 Tax=Thiocapsa sp. TaxID=2024551 RepID=UPI001BCDDD3D|nr:BrnA antitoxin family protein [Thiocapsa sp.]QVL48711.1 MAG: BrnA antitoxin family protein [Thiocapsa sp.]
MHVKSKSGRIFDLPSPEEEERIRTGIAADPDTYELSDEEIAQLRPKAELRKVSTNIRFDADVLEAIKATGPGWQTRINDIVREYVEAHR